MSHQIQFPQSFHRRQERSSDTTAPNACLEMVKKRLYSLARPRIQVTKESGHADRLPPEAACGQPLVRRHREALDVLGTGRVVFLRPVEWSPHRLADEEPEGLLPGGRRGEEAESGAHD